MDYLKHIFGFESIADFLASVFGNKSTIINSLFAMLAALTTFFTNYIYDDAGAVWLVIFLFLFDFITGIYKCYVLNVESGKYPSGIFGFFKTFKSNRLFRGFIVMFAHIILLALSWNMANNYVLFFFLPGLIYGGMLATQFLSILENLVDAKIINAKFYNLIKEKFNLKSLFKKTDATNNEGNK